MWLMASYNVSVMRETQGVTVRGPINLIRKPSTPVMPINTCTKDAIVIAPDI